MPTTTNSTKQLDTTTNRNNRGKEALHRGNRETRGTRVHTTRHVSGQSSREDAEAWQRLKGWDHRAHVHRPEQHAFIPLGCHNCHADERERYACSRSADEHEKERQLGAAVMRRRVRRGGGNLSFVRAEIVMQVPPAQAEQNE